MQDVIRYSEVVNKLDRMIVTTPPYMNNVIAMLTGMTSLEKTKLFDSIDSDRTLRDIICLQTNVFRVNNKIKPKTNKTGVLYDKYPPYKVASHEKILIPVGTAIFRIVTQFNKFFTPTELNKPVTRH